MCDASAFEKMRYGRKTGVFFKREFKDSKVRGFFPSKRMFLSKSGRERDRDKESKVQQQKKKKKKDS